MRGFMRNFRNCEPHLASLCLAHPKFISQLDNKNVFVSKHQLGQTHYFSSNKKRKRISPRPFEILLASDRNVARTWWVWASEHSSGRPGQYCCCFPLSNVFIIIFRTEEKKIYVPLNWKWPNKWILLILDDQEKLKLGDPTFIGMSDANQTLGDRC